MWERLGASPAMDHGCKRKRSSKFDSHRHHVRSTKLADDQTTDNCAGHKSEAAKHRVGGKSVFAMQQDPVVAGINPLLLLHRRQTTTTSDTVLSTAVVSIGVDISGRPTGTFTTTLPTGLSSTPSIINPSPTSEKSSSASSRIASPTSGTPTSPSRSATSGPALFSASPSSTASSGSSSSASKSTGASSNVTSSMSSSTTTSALFSSSRNLNGTAISTTSGHGPRISQTSLSSNSSRSSGATSIVIASAISINATSSRHTSSHSSSSHSRTFLSTLTSTDPRSSSTRSSSPTTSSGSGVPLGGLLGPAASPPTATSTAGNGGSSGGGQQNKASTGVIAGSVVGACAGVAFVLLLLVYFLRWYRRRNGMLENSRNRGAIGAEDPFIDPAPSSGGAMTQQSGAFVPAAMGFLSRMTRHQEPAQEPETPERGFQKISGRKLPSQFSPGISTDPPQLPPTSGGPAAAAAAAAGPAYAYGAAKTKDIGDEDHNEDRDVGASPTSHHSPFDNHEASDDGISEVTSWYRDSSIHTAPPPATASTGLTQFSALQPQANTGRTRNSSGTYSIDSNGPYAGPATSVPQPPRTTVTIPETERLMPSPARTPTVRHANSPKGLWAPGGASGFGHGAANRISVESEVATPGGTQRGTLGRSHSSYDGSRGSRFTEGVD